MLNLLKGYDRPNQEARMASPVPGFGLSQIGQIAVSVKDVDKAVAFYRDVLGLKLLFQAPPGLAFFDCGGAPPPLPPPGKPQVEHPPSTIYFQVAGIPPAPATPHA